MRLVASALVLACLWPVVAGAQVDDPTITVCDECSSDFQYSNAAVEAAGLLPGETKDVYVVNISARQTRAYRVTLTVFGTSGEMTFDINVVSIDGEPALMSDLADALQGIKDFHDAVIQDVPAEELDLPFDSALDLIGGGSGDANRIRLQQRLEDHFNGIFSQFAVHFNDFVRMAGGIFGASPSFPFGDVIVRVNFPNGTTLRVSVVIAKDPTDNGFDLEFDVDVDMESIRGPDGQFIPLEPAHLSGYELTTQDSGFAEAFLDLIRRFDIDVIQFGDSGGACTTTSFTCTVDRCTVTVSC